MKKLTEAIADAPSVWDVSEGCAEYRLSADATSTHMNKKSGVPDMVKEHMTTSHVLAPEGSMPGTVSYDAPTNPALPKLSTGAQDEVEVLPK